MNLTQNELNVLYAADTALAAESSGFAFYGAIAIPPGVENEAEMGQVLYRLWGWGLLIVGPTVHEYCLSAQAIALVLPDIQGL